jgi:hypothetical protein
VDSRLSALRERIELLAAIDRDRQVFGASTHDYELSLPLIDTELAALEAQFGELPDEYRAFVCQLGGHGAGPYYGLISPEAPDDPGSGEQPDPSREFRCDGHTEHGTQPCLLDGTIALAEQGCGGRSVLVVRGPRRGEVWSDWTRERGAIGPEAPSFFAWYEGWLDHAMLQWVAGAAPRIALDGPDDPAELEAIASVFELVARASAGNPKMLRALGYLHLREKRWADASAAFDDAAAVGKQEPAARRHLDRARLELAKGARELAIAEAERGLGCDELWYATCDELRDVLERALGASGRNDEALAVLDMRAAECHASFSLHHRLARERIARGDVNGAGAALERAAAMHNILGTASTIDERLDASFEPIVAELRAAKRDADARALAALAERIRTAN